MFVGKATGFNLGVQAGGSDGSITTLLRHGRLPRRGTYELLMAYSTMPYLRSSVHKIAFNAAIVPMRLYAKTRPGKANKDPFSDPSAKAIEDFTMKSMSCKYLNGNIVVEKRLNAIREYPNHPMMKLLANPNPDMDGRTLRQLTTSWLDVVGDAFWAFDTDANGLPTKIWPLPPHWVTETPSKYQPFYRVNVGMVGVYDIPATNMLWFKDPSLENPYMRGVGHGQALSDELDADEAAAKHIGAFFFNDCLPPALISVKDADDDTLAHARAKFEGEHLGFEKAYRAAWTGGEIDIKRLDTSFNDMQLVQLRKFQRDIVIQTFGLSPEMLGILDNSNRATIFEARALFAENVLTPRLELIRSTLQKFAALYDERLIVAFDDPMPSDEKHALDVAKAAPWIPSTDEWRSMMNLPNMTDGSGSSHVVPLNMAVVSNLLEMPSPVAADAVPNPKQKPGTTGGGVARKPGEGGVNGNTTGDAPAPNPPSAE